MKYVKKMVADTLQYGIHSLLVKYLIVIAVTVIIPAIVISLSVSMFYEDYVYRESTEEKQETLQMNKKMTELVFENAMMTVREISVSSAVDEFLKKTSPETVQDMYKMYETVDTLSETIAERIASNTVITDVCVYSVYGNDMFFLSKGIVDKKMQEKIIIPEDADDLSVKHHNNGDEYILVSNRVRNKENEVIGGVVLYISNANIEKYTDDSRNENNLIVADKKGNIIYAKNSNMLGKNLKEQSFYDKQLEESSDVFYECEIDKEPYRIIKTSTTHSVRNYIFLVSNKVYLEKLTDIKSFMYIALMITLLISLVVAVFLSIKLYMPIYEIVNKIRKTDGLSRGIIDKISKNEILHIISHFDFNIKETERLKTQLDEKIALLNNANLKVLQMQINPHFMHNALDSINWKAIRSMGFDNDVSKMILLLAKLMRYTFENTDMMVSVGKEIENIEAYLEFQKIRLKDKMEISINIPENIKKFSIIKLSLQPIVENIFSHGIKGIDYVGKITISAIEKEEQIELEIRDNGLGMKDKEAERVKERLKNDYTMKSEQIGIANVNQRIKLIFGDKYGIGLRSYSVGNTVFVITIPKIGQE